jgi:hypothetical protein
MAHNPPAELVSLFSAYMDALLCPMVVVPLDITL